MRAGVVRRGCGDEVAGVFVDAAEIIGAGSDGREQGRRQPAKDGKRKECMRRATGFSEQGQSARFPPERQSLFQRKWSPVSTCAGDQRQVWKPTPTHCITPRQSSATKLPWNSTAGLPTTPGTTDSRSMRAFLWRRRSSRNSAAMPGGGRSQTARRGSRARAGGSWRSSSSRRRGRRAAFAHEGSTARHNRRGWGGHAARRRKPSRGD